MVIFVKAWTAATFLRRVSRKSLSAISKTVFLGELRRKTRTPKKNHLAVAL